MTLSFRNALRGGLAAAGLMALAVGQNANAATVPTVFSTGVGVPSTGGVDPNFFVASAPAVANTVPAAPITAGATPAFVLNQSTFPANLYVPNPGAKYISPTTTGFATPFSFYDYRQTFSLTGFVPSTTVLTGTFSDDDYLAEVFLNGVLTSIHGNGSGTTIGNPTPADTNGFGGDLGILTPFTLSSGFVSGLNTIDFVVFNSNFQGANPQTLAVNMSATATLVPEPGSIAMLVGLGVSGAGFLVRRKRRA